MVHEADAPAALGCSDLDALLRHPEAPKQSPEQRVAFVCGHTRCAHVCAAVAPAGAVGKGEHRDQSSGSDPEAAARPRVSLLNEVHSIPPAQWPMPSQATNTVPSARGVPAPTKR